MIFLRHYSTQDVDQVKKLHERQGLGYQLPNLEAETMLVRTVIEEDGEITHAAFLRKTAEAFWIFDPRETRKRRLGRLLMLHREVSNLAKQAGFEDVHAWLPEQLASCQALHRTMLRLGWAKQLWTCYQHEVK